MKLRVFRIVSILMMFSAVSLFCLNIYGNFQDLRPDNLSADVFRFGEEDVKLTPSELESALIRKDDESDATFATRITYALADGLAHIEWLDYHPDLFHQRIPVWENYILYLMGVFSGIPEYERYHFSNPYKSIERGIGICGDASMTLSGLLDEQGIKNTIITVPGHVMVEAEADGQKFVLDADFGVVLNNGIAFYEQQPNALARAYQAQLGRINDGELMIANNLDDFGYRHWQGTKHFITTKYYFEKFAYVAKWLIPVILVLGSMLLYYLSVKRHE